MYPTQPAEPGYFPDGEKIPEKDLTRIFRWPPELSAAPRRNTLVVGARGSGKTTLFRFLASKHHGLALQLNLMQEFQSIEKRPDAAISEPEPGSPPHSRIAGMATALIALAIAEACPASIGLDLQELMPCLPGSVYRQGSFVDAQVVRELRKATILAPDDEFAALYQSERLVQFVEHVAATEGRAGGELLLLLDRPESTSAAALDPAVRLLDQSRGYIALLGVRPAFLSPTVTQGRGFPRPGDNYAVVQLGASPRSPDWQNFVEESVAAQFPTALASYDSAVRDHLIWLSRDSARTAVEIVYDIQSRSAGSLADRFEQAAKMERDAQLTMCKSNLQSYHHDFGALISDIRGRAIADGVLAGPVVVDWTPTKGGELFPELSRTQRLLTAALRLGALCMPEGEPWSPGLRPHRVEFPPLFMWKPGSLFAPGRLTGPVAVHQDESELWESRARPRAMTVFVVGGPTKPEGASLRKSLEDRAGERSRLSNLTVSGTKFDDGVVRNGVWDEIRGSRVIVADLTDIEASTILQLGFAWGLGKPIIPAVDGAASHVLLPEWFTGVPLQYYGNDFDMGQFIDKLSSMLGARAETKLHKRRHGAPCEIVWLNPLAKDAAIREKVEAIVLQEQLHPTKAIGVPSAQSTRGFLASSPSADEALSANLMIAWLDGTPVDTYVAFLCGALAADPVAGGTPVGNRWTHGLPRRIFVMARPGADTEASAQAIRQCSIARMVQPFELVAQVEEFARDCLLWENPIK